MEDFEAAASLYYESEGGTANCAVDAIAEA
jgi:hypothetical protein